MTEARRLQNEEIARILGVPPVFIQDLSKLTYSNAEQQDLQLVKHTVSHWCSALEQECNLKLFGQMNGRRYVRHDLDSLLRGDFKTRMEGLARSVQGSIRTPNEARRSEGFPTTRIPRPTSSSCRARPSSSAPRRRRHPTNRQWRRHECHATQD
jgi:HK97 family phage portal protein